MLALAALGLVNVSLALCQLQERSFSLLFASRPGYFPSGLFGHYNHLADFSVISVALLAARFFFAGDSKLERIAQALGVIAATACVFISTSRGGMVALCAAGATLMVLAALIA